MNRTLLSRLVWVGASLAIWGQASLASGATFSVNPTRVVLTARAATSLVTIRNEGDQPSRFQVNVVKWGQDERGQMQLTPTDDMVVFPLMMTLDPGQERSVRVGAATTFGPVEKSYRLIIEELPPLERSADTANVRMLTRMVVPIFLEPPSPKASARLTDVALGAGVLHFTLQNTANVYFIPDAVTVKAFDQRGTELLINTLEAWYVLAGGSRVYEVEMPQPLCEQMRSLAIEVTIGTASLKARLETPASACGR